MEPMKLPLSAAVTGRPRGWHGSSVLLKALHGALLYLGKAAFCVLLWCLYLARLSVKRKHDLAGKTDSVSHQEKLLQIVQLYGKMKAKPAHLFQKSLLKRPGRGQVICQGICLSVLFQFLFPNLGSHSITSFTTTIPFSSSDMDFIEVFPYGKTLVLSLYSSLFHLFTQQREDRDSS